MHAVLRLWQRVCFFAARKRSAVGGYAAAALEECTQQTVHDLMQVCLCS